MNVEEIKELIAEQNEEAIIFNDLDDAIIGIATRFGMNPVLAYDREKVLDIYVKDGMTYEEASEFFDYNTIGGWCGDGTPVFVDVMRSTNNENSLPVINSIVTTKTNRKNKSKNKS